MNGSHSGLDTSIQPKKQAQKSHATVPLRVKLCVFETELCDLEGGKISPRNFSYKYYPIGGQSLDTVSPLAVRINRAARAILYRPEKKP